MRCLGLREVNRLELTVLVDNYSDLSLSDTDIVKRLRGIPPNIPLAEPGLSCLISVYEDSNEYTILFDSGISSHCLLHNAKALKSSMAVMSGEIGVSAEKVEAVVLSHGHFDHIGGLSGFLNSMGKDIPVIFHPGATARRRISKPPHNPIEMSYFDEVMLQREGGVLKKVRKPSTVASDHILITGEVERLTSFEKGAPGLEANISNKWIPDPFFDDQSIAVYIRGKGLVVISGCAHAGIINTIKHIQKVTGISKVYGVVGGFHLTGANENNIEPTIHEMKSINPDVIVPTHCTGWRAAHEFANEMPDQFILNSVGSTYIFH